MNIDLTIKVDYLPNWGLSEAVREAVQNGKDAETQLGAKMTIKHSGETLYVRNDGCCLSSKALLFGHTTKAGDDATIGQFGEGLKLGILAAIRAGHAVKIRTGSEVWLPRIRHSDQFGCDVLSIEVLKGRAEKNRVQFEIGGIDVETWSKMKSRFAFLGDKPLLTTNAGSVYKDQPGSIFAKGIFVCNDERLQYGYDFRHITVDRDRSMVYGWDISRQATAIWYSLICDGEDYDEEVYQMLIGNKLDTQGFESLFVSKETSERFASRFRRDYGADAIPADSIEQAKQVGHYGKVGIACSPALRNMLIPALGDTYELLRKLSLSVVAKHTHEELPALHRGNLYDMGGRLAAVCPDFKVEEVGVVSYSNDNLFGMYRNGAIEININLLSKPVRALRTLVHEYAHRKGDDGSKEHVSELERIWGLLYQEAMKA